MDKVYKNYTKETYIQEKKHIELKVSKIIDDVKLHGDEALVKFTKQFDKVNFKTSSIKS